MIKHIVIWRLKKRAEDRSHEENAGRLKEKLESLLGEIPGLLKIEVGFDCSAAPEKLDIVLYSEFENAEALEAYQNHPKHQAVIPFVKAICTDRRVVDYEV